MALNYSKKKNLIRSPDEYTRYYGDLRGVDFSSDHTNVHDQRLAYSINMYKDYRAGEGNAIETIPGFRRRFQAPRAITRDGTTYEKIHGIHEFETVDENGLRDRDIIVHAGTRLYLWKNYPDTVNVVKQETYLIPEEKIIELKEPAAEIESIWVGNATIPYEYYALTNGGKTLDLTNSPDEYKNKIATISYRETTIDESDALRIGASAEDKGEYVTMRDAESKSFVFNNRLHIIDGVHHYVMHVRKETEGKIYALNEISSNPYEPTVYRNISVANPPVDISSHEYEQKNLLCSKYKHTYIAADGIQDYPLYDNDFDIVEIKVYGEPSSAYTIEDGVLKIDPAPRSPEEMGYPETYAGVELTFTKKDTSISRDEAMIKKCTIATTFDKRIFLTGNPNYPNRIWYCGYNNTTGYEDATYFGELDYVDDGVENAPITGLIPVADTLAAVKNHAHQDSSVYFHTRLETSEGIIPVSYPSEPGLNGIGCLGACVNFLDDPIFISRLGVEAIGQLSVRLERAIEHRSSLIDAKLVNLDLEKAKVAEWNGYLLVLVDGKIFMADSRQRYTHNSGVMQYEWYYLEGIGTYEGQVKEYTYSPMLYKAAPKSVTIDEVEYETASASEIYDPLTMRSENLLNTAIPFSETANVKHIGDFSFIINRTWDGKTYDEYNEPLIIRKAILCEHRGGYAGGTFYPATTIVTIDDNIFFGCDNGVICSFNFDKRDSDGTFYAKDYSFDNRTIYCGIATKMDNCGVPHLTKSTIKKSTVIKTKAMRASVAKVKIRTNNKGYESLARVTSRVFGFDDMDFSDFSFISTEQTIFAIKEKEKHWVEKQHWIYSDEFCRPFSVNYVAFRYKISGRIKG